MRYRVEFLRETTEEQAVCFVRSLRAPDVDVVQFQAHAWSQTAQKNFGAQGFRIRDLDDQGRIVALEAFDGLAASIH